MMVKISLNRAKETLNNNYISQERSWVDLLIIAFYKFDKMSKSLFPLIFAIRESLKLNCINKF